MPAFRLVAPCSCGPCDTLSSTAEKSISRDFTRIRGQQVSVPNVHSRKRARGLKGHPRRVPGQPASCTGENARTGFQVCKSDGSGSEPSGWRHAVLRRGCRLLSRGAGAPPARSRQGGASRPRRPRTSSWHRPTASEGATTKSRRALGRLSRSYDAVRLGETPKTTESEEQRACFEESH